MDDPRPERVEQPMPDEIDLQPGWLAQNARAALEIESVQARITMVHAWKYFTEPGISCGVFANDMKHQIRQILRQRIGRANQGGTRQRVFVPKRRADAGETILAIGAEYDHLPKPE